MLMRCSEKLDAAFDKNDELSMRMRAVRTLRLQLMGKRAGKLKE